MRIGIKMKSTIISNERIAEILKTMTIPFQDDFKTLDGEEVFSLLMELLEKRLKAKKYDSLRRKNGNN